MTSKERLKDLILSADMTLFGTDKSFAEVYADHLLDNGVIVLPCKVGDTVYKVWYKPCHLGNTYPDGMNCDGCYDTCDIEKTITEEVVKSERFIIEQFILRPSNSVYFLTYEEAKVALEGWKQ